MNQQIAPAAERKLLRHADHVVRPLAAGFQSGNVLHRPLARLLKIFRIHAQQSVAIGSAANVARQINRDRQHVAQIVIGMFADQIDAPGRAGNVRRAPVARLECLNQLLLLRRASQSITPPNTSIVTPQ